ncbi:MAG: hypothetical protein SNF33_02420 [Candidatus Algichlamydia australiensis]|nr:hypothetical protein [Chlamydiales bacterium]
MSSKKFEYYIGEIASLLKDYAKKAKAEADNPKEEDSPDFNNGYLMAYYQVISTMKNHAPFFDLSEGDIGLADINPDKDLL